MPEDQSALATDENGIPEEPGVPFLYCGKCGSVRFILTILGVPDPWAAGVRWCGLFDCSEVKVSESRAREITGLSQERLLAEMYSALVSQLRQPSARPSDAATKTLRDVERRLGMLPQPQVRETSTQVIVDDVPGTLREFTRAAPKVPAIDERRIRCEYEGLKNAWNCRALWHGSLDDAVETLQRRLVDEQSRDDFRLFAVDAKPTSWMIQINVVHGGSFVGYRCWRSNEEFFLCGPSYAEW